MASIRAVKRSRVSYDDSDPRGSSELVSASLGMFSASEHTGMFADVCHLAESIVWGRGQAFNESLRWVIVDPGQNVQQELFKTDESAITWRTEAGQYEITCVNEKAAPSSGSVTYESAKEKLTPLIRPSGKESSDFWTGAHLLLGSRGPGYLLGSKTNLNPFRSWVADDNTWSVVELPPPVALCYRGVWYTFDVPVVYSLKEEGHNGGLMCSALGTNSPILVITSLSHENGSWPLLCDSERAGGWDFSKDESQLQLTRAARASDKDKDRIELLEGRQGEGRSFATAWLEASRRGEPNAVQIKVLWGAVGADFWERALNAATPWSQENLGSLMADEGVGGRLLGIGASVPDSPFALADLEAAVSSMADMDIDTNPNYELVALSSYRFMRDPSVAYPMTIVSFDAGSDGWAIEMFDSVAVNALELALFMLGSRFHL